MGDRATAGVPDKHDLARLDGMTRTGHGFMARCPAHEDSKASLSIKTRPDGATLLHCFAGCATAAVLAAIGLTERDLFLTGDDSNAPDIVATYNYVDEAGGLLSIIRQLSRARSQEEVMAVEADDKDSYLRTHRSVRQDLPITERYLADA